MSEYVPQAWRFGDGPNQYYADQYAQTMARVMDFDLDYDDDRFEQHKAEFLADLAAHDRQVKAEAWDEGAEAMAWAQQNGPEQHWLPYVRDNSPYRAESQETP